jgi:biopolymer transport protein ExbD
VKYLPWITVCLLTLMMYMLSGTLTRNEGVVFDLPETGLGEGESTDLVVLMMPHGHDTFAFFDDARYVMGDSAQCAQLGEQLSERAGKTSLKTLLVLADKRVQMGDLMRLAAIARTSGLEKILFAKRRQEKPE